MTDYRVFSGEIFKPGEARSALMLVLTCSTLPLLPLPSRRSWSRRGREDPRRRPRVPWPLTAVRSAWLAGGAAAVPASGVFYRALLGRCKRSPSVKNVDPGPVKL